MPPPPAPRAPAPPLRPLLPAALAPRAFLVPSHADPTPQLLQAQNAARRDIQADDARCVGRTHAAGAAPPRAARVEATRTRMARTSSLVEAGGARRRRDEERRVAQVAAAAMAENSSSSSHASLGRVSYFRGEQLRQSLYDAPTPRWPGSKTDRSHVRTPADRHSCHVAPTLPTHAAAAPAPLPPVEEWAPAVPHIQITSARSGRHRNQRAEQRRATAARTDARGVTERDPHIVDALGSSARAHPYAADTQAAQSNVATPASHGAESTFAPVPSLADSLREHSSQWWVRLHQSANAENSSPFYVGNQSLYKSEEQRKRQQEGQQQQQGQTHEESKEMTNPPGLLPHIVPSSHTARSAVPVLPLRKLYTSSRLDASSPPAPAVPSSAPSSLRSFLSSAASCPSPGLHIVPRRMVQPHALAWRRQHTMMQPDPRGAHGLGSTAAEGSARQPDSARARMLHPSPPLSSSSSSSLLDPVSSVHGFLSQKNIPRLLRSSNYDRRELFILWVRFKALCALSSPDARTGERGRGIDEATFKRGVARLAVEDDTFVHRVFSLVDEDGSGHIEWEEFLTAMSALEKGDPEAKAKFFFKVYDLDGDGFISRSDLGTMFHSSSMLSADSTTAEVVRTFVEKVFREFGVGAHAPGIAFEDVARYMAQQEGQGKGQQDVWDVFGRSMLHDFGGRR